MAMSAFPACFNAHGVLTTPDGSFSFASSSGKSKAEIQFAKVGDVWIAEYRFRFLCGLYHGSTLPLSVNSESFSVQGKAVVHAARRMMADIQAKCGDGLALPKVQQAELAALLAWVESQIAADQPQPLAGKTFIDLFAGIGGFHLALKQQGARCVAAVERDTQAQAIYRANHGSGFPLYSDIRDVDAATLPAFDVLCAGFPCQSFSAAGKQEGFAAPDKGALFFEVIRIAAARQPSLILLENVEAFATHDAGKTADQAMDALAAIGYAVSMQVLNSALFGVPQQRERLFMVAQRLDCCLPHRAPFVFPAGHDASRTMADILEVDASIDACTAKMVPEQSAHGADPARGNVVGLIDGKNIQGYRVYSTEGKGITLCASSGGPGRQTGLYLVGGKPRRLTPRECARMQGFPESFKPHPAASQACKQFGNSVAVPVVAAIAAAAAAAL